MIEVSRASPRVRARRLLPASRRSGLGLIGGGGTSRPYVVFAPAIQSLGQRHSFSLRGDLCLGSPIGRGTPPGKYGGVGFDVGPFPLEDA